ncbi:hypothetical protein [Paracoccus yeei]|uniref:hypothetical protein n=1 Tax=Paracoccus yeei TaxID=147645 RepID=UPI0037DC80E0
MLRIEPGQVPLLFMLGRQRKLALFQMNVDILQLECFCKRVRQVGVLDLPQVLAAALRN